MKRKTKRLLGVFGLAGVMVMTAIAYALPMPEAHAEDLTDADAVTIQVTVVGPGSKVQLTKPVDGELVKESIVPVSYSFQKMKSISTNLVCMVGSTKVVDRIVDTYEPTEAEETGERNFSINLTTLGVQSDASCQVSLSGKSLDGKDVKDEGAAFEYRAIKIDMGDKDSEDNKPITDEKGDPQVTIGVREDVYSFMLQVYSKENPDVPIFVGIDGEEEPIIVTRDQFDLDKMSYTVNLPMSKYGAKAGWYNLVAIAYGENGKEVISMNTYPFYYDPGTPNVPGTGAIMDNLNISKADYVVTGLIAFGAVAMFGVYLVVRKSRR